MKKPEHIPGHQVQHWLGGSHRLFDVCLLACLQGGINTSLSWPCCWAKFIRIHVPLWGNESEHIPIRVCMADKSSLGTVVLTHCLENYPAMVTSPDCQQNNPAPYCLLSKVLRDVNELFHRASINQGACKQVKQHEFPEGQSGSQWWTREVQDPVLAWSKEGRRSSMPSFLLSPYREVSCCSKKMAYPYKGNNSRQYLSSPSLWVKYPFDRHALLSAGQHKLVSKMYHVALRQVARATH